jgi:hypothetical protein
MKLTDLSPKWIQLSNWSSPARYYVGVSFYCPHCDVNAPKSGPNRRRRLAVRFWPHIDLDDVAKTFACPIPQNGEHHRIGDTFDTLTLTPSVGFESIGHWHGHVYNGHCTP